jgi:dipeptide/tripeptide permease
VLVCGVSHVIMIVGAIPSVLQAGNGMAPFMISLILLAIGAGLFKPNVAPAVLDQYGYQKPYVKALKSGERVIVDPEVTVQRTMLIFYGLINVGAFFPVATVYCEKLIGFWLAFLLPGIIFFLLPVLLWYLNNKLVKYPPDGSALTKVYKIVKTAVAQSKGKVWKKDFLNSAKPSLLAQQGITLHGKKEVTWTDKDVDDVKRTFVACGIFLYYPIYNINDGGIGSVQTSQGATMLTKGTPNDLLSHFNALTIVFAVPLLSYVIYPLLRKHNIRFGRVSRITFGFSIAALSGVFGALVQWKIYQLSPCGDYATTCDDVSNISIWWQIPNVSLGALSECFCNVTAYELAYARSPPGMKALVT